MREPGEAASFPNEDGRLIGRPGGFEQVKGRL
jgi:hypothetical protein